MLIKPSADGDSAQESGICGRSDTGLRSVSIPEPLLYSNLLIYIDILIDQERKSQQ